MIEGQHQVARVAFWALVALGSLCLLFDLTLGLRLPAASDWAEAAGA